MSVARMPAETLTFVLGTYATYASGTGPNRSVLAFVWIVLLPAMPIVGMLYAPACSANCSVPDVLVMIANALLTLKRLVRSAPVGVSKLPIALMPLVYASVALITAWS